MHTAIRLPANGRSAANALRAAAGSACCAVPIRSSAGLPRRAWGRRGHSAAWRFSMTWTKREATRNSIRRTRGGVPWRRLIALFFRGESMLSCAMKRCLVLVAIVLPAALATTAVRAQSSLPLVDTTGWTTADDHRHMLEQLGIRALRPGPTADASAPNAANYDEAKANPYPRLPDPLTLYSGAKVTTADAVVERASSRDRRGLRARGRRAACRRACPMSSGRSRRRANGRSAGGASSAGSSSAVSTTARIPRSTSRSA